jgi:signal transduction histidine kinase
VRYAATKEVKRARQREAARQQTAVEQADVRDQPSAWSVGQSLTEAKEAIAEARATIATGRVELARQALECSGKPLVKVEERFQDVAAEAGMFRVLASIGTELAAFTHEINGLLGMAVGLSCHLDRIAQIVGLTDDQRRELKKALEAAQDLGQNLERQAVYLIDITSVDARRRRSRQGIRNRFEAASRLIRHSAEKRASTIVNAIDEGLRSPPIFPAKLTAVFTNLLSNAVKFSGKEGRIEATAEAAPDGAGSIRIENTGIWLPTGRVAALLIQVAEALQRFQSDGTASLGTAGCERYRGRLVGNAVSVPVAEWIGHRLQAPGVYDASEDRRLSTGTKWLTAGRNIGNGRHASQASAFPVDAPLGRLSRFDTSEWPDLSAKAVGGFIRRARGGKLRYPAGLLDVLESHLVRNTAD